MSPTWFLDWEIFPGSSQGGVVRANLTKCSHERTRRCVIILIEAAARRLWSRFRKQLVQYSGTPWEPMNSPTCPVSSTNPVTDDIICIVGVTGGELVVGAHTVSHGLGSQPMCISYHPPFFYTRTRKPRLRQFLLLAQSSDWLPSWLPPASHLGGCKIPWNPIKTNKESEDQ